MYDIKSLSFAKYLKGAWNRSDFIDFLIGNVPFCDICINILAFHIFPKLHNLEHLCTPDFLRRRHVVDIEVVQ